MLFQCNYGVRFDGPYGVYHFMLGLANEIMRRMEGVGVTGRRVTLKVKQRKTGAKPPPKVCVLLYLFLVDGTFYIDHCAFPSCF